MHLRSFKIFNNITESKKMIIEKKLLYTGLPTSHENLITFLITVNKFLSSFQQNHVTIQ